MKGYYTQFGYKGWVGDRWMLFSTQDEYIEYVKETEQ